MKITTTTTTTTTYEQCVLLVLAESPIQQNQEQYKYDADEDKSDWIFPELEKHREALGVVDFVRSHEEPACIRTDFRADAHRVFHRRLCVVDLQDAAKNNIQSFFAIF